MWQHGPLPTNTYGWGGVVPMELEKPGFYFADFCGDHVIICPGGKRLEADQVYMYNNSLDMPPNRAEHGALKGTRLDAENKPSAMALSADDNVAFQEQFEVQKKGTSEKKEEMSPHKETHRATTTTKK